MKIHSILIGFSLLILPHFLLAEVSLNSLFADHMVVQQKANIPVLGWANALEKVQVKASWGAKSETIARADGNWSLKLKTPKVGRPFQIVVSGSNQIVLDDVLSDEVWLCKGQSNMDFAMSKLTSNSREEQ